MRLLVFETRTNIRTSHDENNLECFESLYTISIRIMNMNFAII